jgi:hypothetical protein
MMNTVTMRLLASLALVAACGSPAVSPSSATSTLATATSLSATKSPDQQRTLPLPTTTRWAIDKPSSNDPQARSLLVLFYDGNAQAWRVVDSSGADVFRIPIQGSGIHGPETCVVMARRPGEGLTWIPLDSVTIDRFVQQYRSYRAVASGIPTGSATLEMTDSGCRRP